MVAAIRVENLVKDYGEHRAVDGIDLEVRQGEILAFLGPNGAGKTTTVEILEGFRTATSGRISVLGENPAQAPRSWRERIGIVLQESEPVPELTAVEAVRMHAGYYANPRAVGETLELVGLSDAANQRSSKLSGGQKRRLDLAIALVGNPELIFLDEPTTGFDPSARREAWAMIDALRSLGNTVLLTTHYMDEAQNLADRITVIGNGKIVANGTAAELAALVNAKPRVSWLQPPESSAPPPAFGYTVTDGRATLETTSVVSTLNELTSWAIKNQVDLADLTVEHPSLEDTYLALTNPDNSRQGQV